jgi:hypothetical protein
MVFNLAWWSWEAVASEKNHLSFLESLVRDYEHRVLKDVYYLIDIMY